LKKSVAFIALAGLLVAALTGCSSSPASQGLVPGTSLTIGEAGPLASLNTQILAAPGSAQAAADIATLTLPSFYSHDASGALVADTDFGAIKPVTSQDFEFTLTGKAKWSDGVAVSPADLAVSWLAATDAQQPGYSSNLRLTSLALANKLSFINGGVRLHFTRPITDWQTVLPLSVPAHQLAKLALPSENLTDDHAVQVIQDIATGANQDHATDVANAFANAFNAPTDGSSYDSGLFLTAGAYKVKSASSSSVVLAADPGYSAGPKASVATVTVSCFNTGDDLANAIDAKQVDLAAPVATTMSNLVQQEGKAKAAGYSTSLGDSGQNEVMLLNYGAGSAFNAATWKNDSKKAQAARQGFFQFVPRAGIWSELAGDKSLSKTDSLVFGSSDSSYQNSVDTNGTSAYQFQDAESSAEGWQAAKFDRTIKIRVVFDANGPRGQLEYSELARLGKLGGFDIANVSSENPASVLASGQWDVYITDQGRLNADNAALATAVGALTGFQNADVDSLISKGFSKDGKNPVASADAGKALDGLLVKNFYGLPLFQTERLVVWTSKIKGYSASTTNNSVVWGYSNWSVSGKGK
jgi:peptide/nickel transport system substrate-binding protein